MFSTLNEILLELNLKSDTEKKFSCFVFVPERNQLKKKKNNEVSHGAGHCGSHALGHEISHGDSHEVSHLVRHGDSHEVSHEVGHGVSHSVGQEVGLGVLPIGKSHPSNI